MPWTLAFDFPEQADPWFPGITTSGIGLTTSLADAVTFSTEDAASRMLEHWPSEAAGFGCVVEVAR